MTGQNRSTNSLTHSQVPVGTVASVQNAFPRMSGLLATLLRSYCSNWRTLGKPLLGEAAVLPQASPPLPPGGPSRPSWKTQRPGHQCAWLMLLSFNLLKNHVWLLWMIQQSPGFSRPAHILTQSISPSHFPTSRSVLPLTQILATQVLHPFPKQTMCLPSSPSTAILSWHPESLPTEPPTPPIWHLA